MTSIVAAALLLTAGCTPGGSDPQGPSNEPKPPPMRAIVAGGSGSDVFSGGAWASDGGIITVGYTASTDGDLPPTHGQENALIVKHGPDGTQQWAKTANSGGGDMFALPFGFKGVAVAGDGSIIAVGNTSSTDGDLPPTHGKDDALIVKFSPDGTQQWANTRGGSERDSFTGVAVTSDGSIIAVGDTSSTDGDLPPSHGKADALIVKYGPDGTQQWAKTTGGSDDDHFSSIAMASDGSIIVVGLTSSTDGDLPPTHGDRDALIIEYSPDGTQQWVRTTGGSGSDDFFGVAVASDGSIITVGATSSTDGDLPPTHGEHDALIIEYSPDGTQQWVKTTGGSGDDGFWGVAVDSEGTIIAVGNMSSTDGDLPPTHGQIDALLVILSPDA